MIQTASRTQGHRHRVTTEKVLEIPVELPQNQPCIASQNPRRDTAEASKNPSEKQMSSTESVGEGCAPWMVTLQNFISDVLDILHVRVALCKHVSLESFGAYKMTFPINMLKLQAPISEFGGKGKMGA